MTTFVLVHGAWGGSYGWREFANLLRSDGHEVYTPSLTGLGERSHLAGPEVNLSMHLTDVEHVFKYEGLSDVVLVGHSYGGMVVTGVADRVPGLISHLVYSDAFLPRDGECCFDLGGASGHPGHPVNDEPARFDGWRVYMDNPLPPDATPEQQRAASLRHPQPTGTFDEPVRLSVPLEERDFSLTYVKAGGEARGLRTRTAAFWEAADRVKDDPRWRYCELPCGHGMHRELPEEMRAILYEVAGLPEPAAKR